MTKKCDESRSFLKTVQVDSAGTREILYLYTLLHMSDCRLDVTRPISSPISVSFERPALGLGSWLMKSGLQRIST